MIELQIVVLMLGLLLASNQQMGLANPFQVYFGIWLLVLGWFYAVAATYPPLSDAFKLLTLSAVSLSFVLLLFIRKFGQFYSGLHAEFDIVCRSGLLYSLQIMVIISVPLAYQNALRLDGGVSLLTQAGYSSLRAALLASSERTPFAYLCTISMLSSSIGIYKFKKTDYVLSQILTVLCTLATFSYLFLSTGRTFSLLFLCLLFVPWIVAGRLRFKGGLIAVILLVTSFTVVSMALGKVATGQGDLVSIGQGIYQHLKMYTVAPFASFAEIFNRGSPMTLGEYSFRFFIAVLNTLDMTDLTPVPMVRQMPGISGLVNVYTVYEVYFLDFSYLGFLFPTVFLFVNWLLYVKAKRSAGPWLFIYAASFYPLVMQFFNDQYMTLLSMWIQITFFSFLLIKSSRPNPNQ